MVKKRELTVEIWERHIAQGIDELKDVGVNKFLEKYYMLKDDIVGVVFEMQMSVMWKAAGKQVYDFDSDFAESILDEKWVDLLPDCIGNRPHDCFYMKLPCEEKNEGVVVAVISADRINGFEPERFPGCLDGKGVYFGGRDGKHERVVVNSGDELLCLCSFAISKTMELMFDDTPIKVYPVDLVANGVAYLCSANADIVHSYSPPKIKKRNNAKRRSMAEWNDVGYRIGSELRSYKYTSYERKEHQGGTVRPHVRRAHWHHYWTGPRDGKRKLVLKWLPPTLVGMDDDTKIPATVHRVRGAANGKGKARRQAG